MQVVVWGTAGLRPQYPPLAVQLRRSLCKHLLPMLQFWQRMSMCAFAYVCQVGARDPTKGLGFSLESGVRGRDAPTLLGCMRLCFRARCTCLQGGASVLARASVCGYYVCMLVCLAP